MLKDKQNLITGELINDEALVGVHDMYKEGEWVTVDGVALDKTGYARFSTTYWNVTQPDNLAGNQNCGAVTMEDGMDDVKCTDKFAFFCEKSEHLLNKATMTNLESKLLLKQ